MTNETENRSWQWVVCGVLFMLGLGNALLTVRSAGLERGLSAVLHNPGKHFFLVVLLPAGVGIVLHRIPLRVVGIAWREHRWAQLLLTSVLFGVLGWVLGDELRHSFHERVVGATWLRDPVAVAELVVLSEDSWREIEQARGENASRNELKTLSEKRRIDYLQRFDALLGADANIWRDTSFRGKFGYFVTIVGAASVAVIFWVLLLQWLVQEPLTAQTRDAYLALLVVLCLWLPLRAYSEWHGNFGTVDLVEYVPFPVVIGMALLALLLVVVVLRKGPRTKTIAASMLTLLITGVGVLSKLKPEWFEAAANSVSRLGTSTLVACQLFLALAVLAIAHLFLAPPDADAPSPPRTE